MIGVIPGGDQRPGQEDMSVPGARGGTRLPGPAHVPLVCRWRRDGMPGATTRHPCGVMLAGQARWEGGSMQACHHAISHGEGLVHHWRVTQLTRLGIPAAGRGPGRSRRLASDRPAGPARLCPGTGRGHRPLFGRLRRSRPRLAAAPRPAPGPGGNRQAGGRHHGPFGRSRTRFPGRAVAREESPLAAPGPAGPVPQPAEPGTGSSSG
jgi:hypothetical protein